MTNHKFKDFGLDGIRSLGMPDYFYSAFDNFTSIVDFSNANVLEIGGSAIPEYFIKDILNVKNWVSVDIIDHLAGSYQIEKNPKHYTDIGISELTSMGRDFKSSYEIYNGFAENIPNCRDGVFDIVVSINAFEHIHKLKEVLAKAKDLLKPSGVLISQFGPIWSGINGSHFWINNDLNFMNVGFVPIYSHILLEPEELADYLFRKGIDKKIIDEITHQHYKSDFINRLFFEDYELVLKNSGFSNWNIKGLWDWHPSRYLKKALINTYGDKNFHSIGISLMAVK
jgi:SAM-dependent methyltransferase